LLPRIEPPTLTSSTYSVRKRATSSPSSSTAPSCLINLSPADLACPLHPVLYLSLPPNQSRGVVARLSLHRAFFCVIKMHVAPAVLISVLVRSSQTGPPAPVTNAPTPTIPFSSSGPPRIQYTRRPHLLWLSLFSFLLRVVVVVALLDVPAGLSPSCAQTKLRKPSIRTCQSLFFLLRPAQPYSQKWQALASIWSISA
jgi:hypothetical protein